MLDLSIENIFFAISLTLLAGASTTIGAIIANYSNTKDFRILSLGLGFSAGVMIYVSFVEILVKSRESFASVYPSVAYSEMLTLVCFFGGIVLSAGIDKILPHDVNPKIPKDVEKDMQKEIEDEMNEGAGQMQMAKIGGQGIVSIRTLKRTGIFTAIAIAIHNFPEGFATFTAALADPTLGITLAVAIAIHNIPEGMAISLPIYYSTKNKKKAFWYATFSGLAEPVGAVVGFFLLYPLMGDATLAITFGLVAGIMVFISFNELLPAAREYGNSKLTITGFSLGMLLMALSLVAFKL